MSFKLSVTTIFFSFMIGGLLCNAQLTPSFYNQTCSNVQNIIRDMIRNTSVSDPRIGASLIRLHFHDCFVQGCDASLLLDGTPTMQSEKEHPANNNSARGFELVDAMKARLESVCPGIVSCADILTIASEESVVLAGGPSWAVPLGRRDGLTANFSLGAGLPSPFETLDILKAKFAAMNLNTTDLVALSGAHTFGRAQCRFFRDRLYNFNGTGNPDPSLDHRYLDELKAICPETTNGTILVNLDPVTPDGFDSSYFSNLRIKRGLLQSDQELFSTPGADTLNIVDRFTIQSEFFRGFVDSMIKMGNISPLTGTQGEIRLNCRRVNSALVAPNDGSLVSSI